MGRAPLRLPGMPKYRSSLTDLPPRVSLAKIGNAARGGCHVEDRLVFDVVIAGRNIGGLRLFLMAKKTSSLSLYRAVIHVRTVPDNFRNRAGD